MEVCLKHTVAVNAAAHQGRRCWLFHASPRRGSACFVESFGFPGATAPGDPGNTISPPRQGRGATRFRPCTDATFRYA
jgi:hypothetical protein